MSTNDGLARKESIDKPQLNMTKVINTRLAFPVSLISTYIHNLLNSKLEMESKNNKQTADE